MIYPRLASILFLLAILVGCGNSQPTIPTTIGQAPTVVPTATPGAILQPTQTSFSPKPPSPLLTIGQGEISDCAYSPDGNRLGVVTSTGVFIFDSRALKQLNSIPNGKGVAAFSPDWSYLAIGMDSEIELLHIQDNKIVGQLTTDEGKVTRLLFSPDGESLASFVWPPGDGEQYNNFINVWRMSDQSRIADWQGGLFSWGAAFSPDGFGLIIWRGFAAAAQAWRLAPGPSMIPIADGTYLNALAYSPDGKFVASQSVPATVILTDENIKIQRASNGAAVQELPASSQPQIKRLLFSPGSSLLISVDSDGVAKVWRIEDGNLLHSFPALSMDTPCLAISPDARTLVLSAVDGLAFYDLTTGQEIAHLGNWPAQVRQAVLSPRGDAVAGLLGTTPTVWTLPDGQLKYTLPSIKAYRLAWSPDGSRLALGEADGHVLLLQAADSSPVLTLPAHKYGVQGVTFSPDGDLLATSSMESVKVWRSSDGMLLEDISLPGGGWVNSPRFSPNSQLLAAFSADSGILVWQVNSWTQLAQILVSSFGDSDVVGFTVDGKYLAVGQTAGLSLRPIPPSSGSLLTLSESDSVVALRISPDGSLLVVGLADGNIRFYNLPEGRILYTLQAGGRSIVSVDFSADGRNLLSASANGEIKVWSLETLPIR